jgi:hypothetical protein
MKSPTKRRGATVTELAIILAVFLTLTMGMLDLGIGVFRYHIVANAARHGARQAIVHGQMATSLGVWGPSSIDVYADASSPILDGPKGIRKLLIGCNLSATRVQVDWPNGANGIERQVRVTVTSPYQPIMLFIFPSTVKNLTASSTMEIAH